MNEEIIKTKCVFFRYIAFCSKSNNEKASLILFISLYTNSLYSLSFILNFLVHEQQKTVIIPPQMIKLNKN